MNITGFLDHMRARGYSNRTIDSYGLELRKFEYYLREHKLRVNMIQPRDVEAYLRHRDPEFLSRPGSTRHRMAVLASFYDFVEVMSNGHVRNPLAAIRYPRRQPPTPKPITEEQVAVLMDGIGNKRDKAIVALLLHSGLRLSELCSLDRDSIVVEHLPDGQVVGVGRVLGKGTKEREFMLDLPTLRLIFDYLAERGHDDTKALFLSNRRHRISGRAIQHLLRSWCRRLGLKAIHPHQLRSTFATRLDRVGFPTKEISSLLGHASLDTTLIYLKPDARRLRSEYFAAMEQLNG